MPHAKFNVVELLRSSHQGESLLQDPIAFMRGSPETLLFHQIFDPRLTPQERLETQNHLIRSHNFESRKRYALRLSGTFNGEVCVKLRPQRAPHRLLGPRHARNEYRRHEEVARRGFAAVSPLGYASFKDIQNQTWQCFVQEGLPQDTHSGESLRTLSLEERALVIARELAKLHEAEIFHGDLKPYHVVVSSNTAHWLYVDLDPVRFGVSRRRRTINLYQALRYFLDADPRLAEPLIQTYIRALPKVPADAAQGLVTATLKLLKHKMETHRGPKLAL